MQDFVGYLLINYIKIFNKIVNTSTNDNVLVSAHTLANITGILELGHSKLTTTIIQNKKCELFEIRECKKSFKKLNECLYTAVKYDGAIVSLVKIVNTISYSNNESISSRCEEKALSLFGVRCERENCNGINMTIVGENNNSKRDCSIGTFKYREEVTNGTHQDREEANNGTLKCKEEDTNEQYEDKECTANLHQIKECTANHHQIKECTANHHQDKECTNNTHQDKKSLPLRPTKLNNNHLTVKSDLHFTASWTKPFTSKTKETFYTQKDGKSMAVEVEMMSQRGQFNVYKNEEEKYSAVELEFSQINYSFIAILPDNFSDFTETFAGVDFTSLSGMMSNMKKKNLFLQIPKFELQSDVNLKDLSYVIGKMYRYYTEPEFYDYFRDSKLGEVKMQQKFKLSVQENGVTTGIHKRFLCVEKHQDLGEYETLCFNRPFFFFIINKSFEKYYLPIVMGKVYNPLFY